MLPRCKNVYEPRKLKAATQLHFFVNYIAGYMFVYSSKMFHSGVALVMGNVLFSKAVGCMKSYKYIL